MGSHINKLDAKGRVAAPADFRRALDGDPIRGFYCLPSLRGPYLECGGGDFISYIKEMMRDNLDPFDPDRDALETHVIAKIRSLPFDTEGRVVIPEQFREHARLAERVIFQGRGETFTIMPAEGAEERDAATLERAKAALLRLRNPKSGGGT